MFTPAEHPSSRTAKLRAGVGSTRSYMYVLIPLAASTDAARRTNSSLPWRVSRHRATVGPSRFAFSQSARPCVALPTV